MIGIDLQWRLRLFFLSLLIPCLFCQCAPEEKVPENLIRYVDPQIGSVHGRWFFYTPAARPFGMAKLAPHTNAYGSEGGWGPVGYDDRHSSIEGFGHFHEFQIGGLVFMPTTGRIQTVPGTLEDPDAGYRSRYDKATEYAEAGYYSVFLQDHGVQAEITATDRVGFHRYTYPATKEAHLIIDIGHKQGESSDVTDAMARLVNGNEIEGYIETYPEYVKFCDPGKRVKMYFVVQLSKDPDLFGSFIDSRQRGGESFTKGINNGLYLTFTMSEGEALEVQTGLSYTSVANARLNMNVEGAGMTFDMVRRESADAWNEQLGRIHVEGGSEADRIKFYTGLYHVLLGRGLASDTNGQYPVVDDRLGQIPLDPDGSPQYHHYNTDGIWGGFWNLSQVWALAYPRYFSDYVQSNVDFYMDRGWLHDGRATGVFTNGVQTNFQGLLLASAYNVGIRDFDVKTGYEAALKNELEYHGRNLGNGKYDLSYFVKDHYIPYKDTLISNGWVFNFGASHTMEYSFSSYAVAQMARQRDDPENYQKLMMQADYWRNLFDPETKFIRPRLEEGPFIADFDPVRAWDGFQEGNAFQYTWYVPHDPAGLLEAVGDSLFNKRLGAMFDEAAAAKFGTAEKEIHSFSGVGRLYNHGNQPSLHNAWLFNYSGKPWLAQKWVRAICDQFYGTTPLHGYGIGQDEDQGQLGAWFVLASMGLFDVQGHSAERPTFQFSGPLFDKVTILLDKDYYEGDMLVISTARADPEDTYVQSVRWNGSAVEKNWMYRDELMKGGELHFVLGKDPNYDWGMGERPPSMSDEK